MTGMTKEGNRCATAGLNIIQYNRRQLIDYKCLQLFLLYVRNSCTVYFNVRLLVDLVGTLTSKAKRNEREKLSWPFLNCVLQTGFSEKQK